jgi:outer membrane scaffolding protein for murein synthesis (MipA/OmpV family)
MQRSVAGNHTYFFVVADENASSKLGRYEARKKTRSSHAGL